MNERETDPLKMRKGYKNAKRKVSGGKEVKRIKTY